MDDPLSDTEIAERLQPLQDAAAVLVAVSGGPDSLCLLRAVAGWRAARKHGPVVKAATVDHGLRPESGGEAARVAGWAAELGIPHATLAWTGRKPSTGLQAAAREARYALLEAHAAAIGAEVLLTAHHADDQAETVLMRLLRGSGIHGLSGMPARRLRGDGLLHLRPFLDVAKERLVARLAAEGAPWIEDPSNRDPRFARTAMRDLLPLLEAHGFGRERLLALRQRAERADLALDRFAAQAVEEDLIDAGGQPALAAGPAIFRAALLERPDEIVVRVLIHVLVNAAASDAQPLRLERVEALVGAIRQAQARRETLRRTLAGHVVTLDRHARVTISGEKPRKRGQRPLAT